MRGRYVFLDAAERAEGAVSGYDSVVATGDASTTCAEPAPITNAAGGSSHPADVRPDRRQHEAVAIDAHDLFDAAALVLERLDYAALREQMQHALFFSGNVHLCDPGYEYA